MGNRQGFARNGQRSGDQAFGLQSSVFGLPPSLVLFLIVACGCGGPSDVVQVFGTVTYGGQPLESGQIRFRPIEGTKGPTSGADIANGQYRVTNRGGVPFGKHRVEIRSYRPDEDAAPISDLHPGYEPGDKPLEQYIPDRYNTQSELTVVVPVAAKNHKANFELNSS
jgi:hypothetical protein